MGEYKAATTRLRREYMHIQAEKIPHIVARPTEKNILTWHYVLHDLPTETPYCGGIYWGKLVFPKEYPLKPPAIYMLTPSGRFETNTRLCLSMSDFHPESWNPSWRIESILLGLVSFMLDVSEPRTTGGMRASTARRREYAKAAFDFNRGNKEFRELFPEFCDESRRCPDGSFFFDREPQAGGAGSAEGAGAPGVAGTAAPPSQGGTLDAAARAAAAAAATGAGALHQQPVADLGRRGGGERRLTTILSIVALIVVGVSYLVVLINKRGDDSPHGGS